MAALVSAGAAAVTDYQTYMQLQTFPPANDIAKRRVELNSPAARQTRAAALTRIWDPTVLAAKVSNLNAAFETFAGDPSHREWASYHLVVDTEIKGTAEELRACVSVGMHANVILDDGTALRTRPSAIKLKVQMARADVTAPWRMVAYFDSGDAGHD